MFSLEGYTWRMLQCPGMFDLRGCGQYASALEHALADGVIGLADVVEHCRDLTALCDFPCVSPEPRCPDGASIGTYLVQAYGADGRPEGYACALNWGQVRQVALGEAVRDFGGIWQMLDLLSRTAGNLSAVPADVMSPNIEGGGLAACLHGRFDQVLSVVYRWVMGAREPNGAGLALRFLLESECAEVSGCTAWNLIPSGASGRVSNTGMARWICGPDPLGNPIDRQRRWDAFVIRNYFHDYMGPARFEGFGPPVACSEDPERCAIQVSARIIARGNRMRNAAASRGLARRDIDSVFGE